MAEKTRLRNGEKNTSWGDLDDLDTAFLEMMKEQGIDENLIYSFAQSAQQSNKEHEKKEEGNE